MLNFIFGALTMWCAVGIALIVVVNATHEEDKTILFCGGPFVWLWCGAIVVWGHFRDWRRHKRYKALVICPDEKIRWCESDDLNHSVNMTGYGNATKLVSEDAEIMKKFLRDKYSSERMGNSKTTPNIRYAPPSVWRKYESVYEYIKRINDEKE